MIPVNITFSLSMLNSETALASTMTALSDDFWAQSADLTWTIRLQTAGEAPIFCGIANGDLTVVEIKEALNASPISRSDIVAREHARRPVRKVGAFNSPTTDDFTLNDGKPVRTTIKMYMAEGTELNAYVFNASGGALTTGAVVRVWGSIYGSWK